MLPRIYFFHVINLTLIADLWLWANADIFTSTAKMESLLDTRERVINDLEDYVRQEDSRLHYLRQYLDLYTREQERAIRDVPSYVGNPINAFTLIKRLSLDFEDIKNRTRKVTEFGEAAATKNNKTISYPSLVDVKGAGVALKRLQKMYKLKVKDIAQGVIRGVIFNNNRDKVALGLPIMTASDCNELGDILFKMKDYKNALAWQMEALRKYRLETDIPHTVNEIDLLDYVAVVHFHLGDFESAAEWTIRILMIDPDNQRAKVNLMNFEQSIIELNSTPLTVQPKMDEQIQDQGVKNNTAVEKAEKEIHSQNKTETLVITSDENNSGNIKLDATKEKKGREKTDIKRGDENVIFNTNDNRIESVYVNERNTNTKGAYKTEAISEIETRSIDENKIEARSSKITGINSDSNTYAKNITSYGLTISNVTRDTERNGIETQKKETEEERIRRIEDGIIDLRKDAVMNEALCRGEYEVGPEMSSRLFCRYRNDASFLKLAPIKMEQKYIDPDVFLFYDVISNDEIEHVKGKAKPNFQRARLGSSYKDSKVSDYRISMSSWLWDSASEVLARLTRRVSHFTGLDMTHAEALQASNYGIGGHFGPHVDYSPLSEVAQGGATVFPKLGLSVFPIKGAAIFWYNLQRSAEGNRNSRHSACPVLEGSKWVANKWIRLPGQEFKRSCLLEHQREDVVPKVPAPVIKPEAQEYLNMELGQF